MKKFFKIFFILFIIIIEAGAAFGLAALGHFIYNEFYIRYHIDNVYKTSTMNPSSAVENAKQLLDRYYYEYNNRVYAQDKALQIIEYAADKGDAEAQYHLGRYYAGRVLFSDKRKTDKSDNDSDKAAYWYLQSANQEYGQAQAELAQCYKLGYGVEQDFRKNIKWLIRGCDNNNALAQWRLGNLYYYGLSYRYNESEKEYYWLYMKADSDWGDDDNDLKKGDDVYYKIGGNKTHLTRAGLRNARWTNTLEYLEPDLSKAKYYWKLAADQGLAEAKESLQRVYEDDDK